MNTNQKALFAAASGVGALVAYAIHAGSSGDSLVPINGTVLVAGAVGGVLIALVTYGARRLDVKSPALSIVSTIVGLVSSVLLLAAASGILFDLLILLGIMPYPGDGTQDPPIDVPATATRLLALVACAAVAILALDNRRPPTIGATSRIGGWLALAAALSSLPYMLIKIHWAMGGRFGVTNGELHLDFLAGWGTVIMEAIGTVGCLALAFLQFRGRVLGGRSLPRPLVLIPGWIGAGLLITTGLPGVISILADPTVVVTTGDRVGISGWFYPIVYGGWLVWGILTAIAVAVYQSQSRPSNVNQIHS